MRPDSDLRLDLVRPKVQRIGSEISSSRQTIKARQRNFVVASPKASVPRLHGVKTLGSVEPLSTTLRFAKANNMLVTFMIS